MELTEILARVDHTLLKQTATFSDIQQVCDDGIRFHCASVCIPPLLHQAGSGLCAW